MIALVEPETRENVEKTIKRLGGESYFVKMDEQGVRILTENSP